MEDHCVKRGTVCLVWLIACLPRTWGCGPAPVAEVTRTDSLGIRIVTYPALETVASPSTPSTTRELRIGGSDALEGQELEFLLGRPAIIGSRLYDGTLVGSYVLPPGELIAMTEDRAVLLTYDEYHSPIVDVDRITDWR